MNDRIEQLLHDADASASSKPPASPGAFAERVRQVARRRRIVRRAIGVTTTCAIAFVATATFLNTPREPEHTTIVVTAPDARAELVALRAEADRESERAARMIASERSVDRAALARRTRAAPDPAERSRQQLERAALSIVYEADRQAARGAPGARQLYAAAAESFPNTHWAAVARERLAGERERKDGSG